MSPLQINEAIRCKELQIDRLNAEIREARGYIVSLRRRLEPESKLRTQQTRGPEHARM